MSGKNHQKSDVKITTSTRVFSSFSKAKPFSFFSNSNKKKYKRAQITLFILIGVILLFAFSLFYMFESSSSASQLNTNELRIVSSSDDTNTVKSFVTACLKKSVDEINDQYESAVWTIGKQGGFLELGNTYNNGRTYTRVDVSAKEYYLPILHNGISSISIDTTVMEQELGKKILGDFMTCFDEQILESKTGYAISSPKSSSMPASITVTINQDNIVTNLIFPINMTKGDNFFTLKDFRVESPIRLGRDVAIANRILSELDSSVNSPKQIDLTLICSQICTLGQNYVLAYSLNSLADKDTPGKTSNGFQLIDYYTDDNYHKKSYVFRFAVDGSLTVSGRCTSCP